MIDEELNEQEESEEEEPEEEEEEEEEEEDEEDEEDTGRPECPYCGDNEGNCDHVILEYDASFDEYLSGYLAHDRDLLDELKSELLELIRSGHKPELKEGYIKEIWDFAVNNMSDDAQETDLDETAYFSLLSKTIDSFDGERLNYEDSGGSPGYSSAYVIFYSKNPEETIQDFNEFILDEIR